MHPSIPTASLHPPSCALSLWMLQVLPFKARGGKTLGEGRQKWVEVGWAGQSRLVKKEALTVMEKGGGDLQFNGERVDAWSSGRTMNVRCAEQRNGGFSNK